MGLASHLKKLFQIIGPLRRRRTEARKKFAGIIRNARGKRCPDGSPYEYYGELPLSDSRPASYSWFRRALKKLHEMRSMMNCVKVLDIGPGRGSYLEELIRLGNVELHTLSPENINPLKRRAKGAEWVNKGSDKKPNWEIINVKMETNLKHNPLLKHHVGTAETYNLKALGGFDLIHSHIASPRQSPHPIETAVKISRALNEGGVAFFDIVFPEGMDAEHGRHLIKAKLGHGFGVEIFGRDGPINSLKIKRVLPKH